VIDRARVEADGVLIVDAGDMLLPAWFPPQKSQPPDPGEIIRRARLVLESYARMGIHAVLPAERDLGIGPARLRQLIKSLNVPAVASNLVDSKGHLIFPPDRIVTIAGIPIGIFGVVQPSPQDEAQWRGWEIRATDPTSAAREEIVSLRRRGAKMIVALLHLGDASLARKLLEDAPGISWAVQGHTGRQLETPETVGTARLLEAMTLGKFAGRLDVHVVDGQLSFSDKGERAEMATIIADHRRQLVDLERRAAEDKTEQLRDYYKLRREGLTVSITREIELARRLPPVIRGSWYENRIIPLDSSIPDHRAISLLVAAYNAESTRRASAGLPTGIAPRDPRALETGQAVGLTADAKSEEPIRYVGSAACAGCHPDAWRVFQATKHARALAALGTVGRDHDPGCVGCHVTGYLVPGGTGSVAVATQRLKNVGCESCHGPGLGHVTGADKKGTTQRTVAETVCRGCHTPDQTNGEFEYETFRKAVLGRGHGA
jgi:hypothetical protein